MIGAEIKDVRGYFEQFTEASEDLQAFLYGEIRHKLDAVNSTIKRYPVMVMDQPNVRTTIRGGVYFNTYNMGISIVEKVKDGSLKAHAAASDRTFTLLGKLIKQLIADQRQYNFTHSPLAFDNDEVDTNLVADHVGWRTEFQLMLACGNWVR